MNWMDQAEEAYKNGYAAGKKDAIKAIRSVSPDNREKVIRGLEMCVGNGLITRCRECPYNGILCVTPLLRDALALLREQEERIKRLLENAKILSDALDEKEEE